MSKPCKFRYTCRAGFLRQHSRDPAPESFIPHLNLSETQQEPASLDGLQLGDMFFASLINTGKQVKLRGEDAALLKAKLATLQLATPGNPLLDFIRSRYTANADGDGSFNRGVQALLVALTAARICIGS